MRALDYHDLGWIVVPIPERGKSPGVDGWPSLRLDRGEVLIEFARPRNIGIHLGPSGLVDIDLDCPEARELAQHVLPPSRSFGRPGAPRSHWIYSCPDVGYRKFLDPIDGACLLEIRAGHGKQSVFPGSIHESGEPIEWHDATPIAKIDPSDDAAKLAAMAWCRKHDTEELHPKVAGWLGVEPEQAPAAPMPVLYSGTDETLIDLITQHYPAKGSRHDYRLAVAGACWRAGIAQEAARAMLERATAAAGAKVEDVAPAIADTWSGARNNTGAATLIEVWSAKPIADRIDALTTPDVRTITWAERLDAVAVGGSLDVFDDAEILNGLARMALTKDSRLPALWAKLKDARFSHLRELKEAATNRAREIARQAPPTAPKPVTHREAEGMMLPEGYLVEAGRLMHGEELVINGELLLLAKCPTPSGVYARVAFRAPGKRWQTSVVPYEDLISTSTVHRVLAHHGCNVTSLESAAIVGFVRDYVSVNGEALDRPIATRTGWHESGAFVLGREVIGGPPELRAEYPADNQIALRFVAGLGSGGDRDTHFRALRDVVTAFPVAATCVAASLAAPLVTRLGRPTVAIHLAADGGAGKTRTVKIAASVWGANGGAAERMAGGIVVGANLTGRALEIAAAARNGLPFLVSDMKHFPGLTEILHDIINGDTRARATQHGGSTQLDPFQCGALVTEGEVDLKQLTTRQGFHRRVIEVPLALDDAQRVRLVELACLLSDHYGYLGREFIDLLEGVTIDDSEIIDAKLATDHDTVTALGSLLGAARLAAPLIGADPGQWCAHIVRTILGASQAAEGRAVQADRAAEDLREILIELGAQIAATREQTRHHEGGRPWVGYRDGDDAIVILSTVVNQRLQQRGHQATTSIVRALADRGLIERSGAGDRIATKARIGGVAVWCYRVPVEQEKAPGEPAE